MCSHDTHLDKMFSFLSSVVVLLKQMTQSLKSVFLRDYLKDYFKVVYLENRKSASGLLSNSTLLQFPQYLLSTHRQLSVLKNILTEMERETKRNMPAKALFLGPSIASQYSSSIPGYISHTDIQDIL